MDKSKGFHYGNLMIYESDKDKCAIIHDMKIHIVDSNTVGQFTGLYDCDNTPIYEGDIVHFKNKSSEFDAQVIWSNEMCRFMMKTKNSDIKDLIKSKSINVIGNIHQKK